jgi:NADPH-dependent 2,4-dienoyl-CoA reductase/sulfur reductase-like enzyme
MKGIGVMCSVNPAVGNEAGKFEINKAKRSKKVAVIGGGPAGMEAARVASMRGHRVTLYEKDARLGGQLNPAVIPPHKSNLAAYIDYLKRQMSQKNIVVHTGSEATADMIRKFKPDAVIIATGVVPAKLDIPGAGKPFVLSARDVLDGKATGAKVVVIGGGLVGCETAEFLQKQGKQVTVIEMLDEIAGKMVYAQKVILETRLKAAGVNIITGARCKKITDAGLVVTTKAGGELHIDADSIIIAVGDKPNKALEDELKGIVHELYTVGDCVKLEGIAEAIAAGHLAALAI